MNASLPMKEFRYNEARRRHCSEQKIWQDLHRGQYAAAVTLDRQNARVVHVTIQHPANLPPPKLPPARVTMKSFVMQESMRRHCTPKGIFNAIYRGKYRNAIRIDRQNARVVFITVKNPALLPH